MSQGRPSSRFKASSVLFTNLGNQKGMWKSTSCSAEQGLRIETAPPFLLLPLKTHNASLANYTVGREEHQLQEMTK
jgi:hypothetical protein